MQQCNANRNLYNVHDILSNFCDFDFDLMFFASFCGKDRLTVLFERCDNSCNPILSLFANLLGESLRVYVLFDLVT